MISLILVVIISSEYHHRDFAEVIFGFVALVNIMLWILQRCVIFEEVIRYVKSDKGNYGDEYFQLKLFY